MSYQVLALKYRPQTFDKVVGQAHVTTTLSNAIKKDRVAHAILLTGPRGTGKTTVARILAKAMNCENGPVPSPCNTCKLCREITEGHCADVFEIDGASNNSVDQVRDLRENVTYMPSAARFKIYIIDEVHMLSTAAFNALLKTLEEPPDHVMFIFATTEVHKIPATILSRCQRHDLGRVDLAAIAKHLGHLCSQEGFQIDEKSLETLALEADGSIRDSLSLLDRVLSSASTTQIDHQDILTGLGLLDRKMLHDIAQAVFENNGAFLIENIELVNSSGIDLKKYYSDLITHFRNLNVLKICGPDSPAVNLPGAEKETIHNLVSSRSSQYLTQILQHLLNEENLVRYASDTKTAIELVFLKLLDIDPGKQIDQIISRLDTLARQFESESNVKPENVAETFQKNETERKAAAPPNKTEKSISRKIPEEPAPTPVSKQEMHSPAKHATPTWQDFLKHLEDKLPFVHALLQKSEARPVENNSIVVELNSCSAFDRKRLNDKQSKLEELCHKFLGKKLILKLDEKNCAFPQGRKKNKTKAVHAAINHPLVVDAQKMFNGSISNF